MISKSLLQKFGIWRSVAIYYWKPFNRKRLRKFYSQFIGDGDLCFDLGAHVGNRTNCWESLGAKVIAVEPQPPCLQYLNRRFRNKTNVTVVPCAVGSREGEMKLHVSSLNPTISTLSHDAWREQLNSDAHYPIDWDDEIRVRVTTLEQLIKQYGMPVFCKIDVENFELEVLKGLKHAIPQLSFEYYPPSMENTKKCLSRLEDLGDYEYNWSLGESMRLMSPGKWLDRLEISGILDGYSTRYEYGDIYARIQGFSRKPENAA